MESEKFLDLIEKIRSNTYVERELDLSIDEFNENRFADSLNDEQVVILADALKHNTHITKVNLRCNEIGDRSAIALASVDTLQGLNLDQTFVRSEGLIELARSNLRSLTIPLGVEAKHMLDNQRVMQSLTRSKTIEELNIVYGILKSDWLAELVARNTTIKILRLGYVDADDECLKFISQNKTLQELHIDRDKLTDKGAYYLSGNTSIEILKIHKSDITDQGAVFLTLLPALKDLEIYSGNITAEGAKIFIHSKLREFKIHYGSPYSNTLSLKDAGHISLAFPDVLDDNGDGQPTKKAKLDNLGNHVTYYIEEPLLLGSREESFVAFDDSGYSSQIE